MLQLLELRIRFVGVISGFHQFFQFFNNGKFHLQVFFLLAFQLGNLFAAFFLDNPHQAFEFFFRRVLFGNKIFNVSTVVCKLYLSSFQLGIM